MLSLTIQVNSHQGINSNAVHCILTCFPSSPDRTGGLGAGPQAACGAPGACLLAFLWLPFFTIPLKMPLSSKIL